MLSTLSDLPLLLFSDIFLTASLFLGAGACLNWALFWLAKKRNLTIPFWINYLLLGILVLVRCLGLGYVTVNKPTGIGIDLAIAAFAVPFMIFSIQERHKQRPAETKSLPTRTWVDIVAVVVILGLSVSTLWNLGAPNLEDDEFFQFEAATSYLHNFGFYRYDFQTEQPMVTVIGESQPYRRALIGTWIIAQSMRVFGNSEFSARLPSAICYVFFVIGIYFLIRFWKKDQLSAALIAFLFLFMDIIVFQGRIVRFYGLFLLTGGAAIYAWFRTYCYSLKFKRFMPLLGMGALATALTALAFHFQNLIVVFFPAFGAFIFFEWMRCVLKEGWRSRNARVYYYWFICGLFAICAGFLLNFFIPFAENQAGGFYFRFLENPYIAYEAIPFKNFPLFGLAIILYLASFFRSLRGPLAERFCAMIPFPLFVLFIFFLKRPLEDRFFLIATVFIGLTIGLFGYWLLSELFDRVGRKKYPIIFALFVLLLVPLSWPGVQPGYLFQQSLADERYLDLEHVYSYIKENKTPDEVLISFHFRSYYWGSDDQSTTIYLHKDYPGVGDKLVELKKLLKSYQKGWIVLPTSKYNENGTAKHQKILEFLQSKTEQIYVVPGETDYQVFHFDFTKKK